MQHNNKDRINISERHLIIREAMIRYVCEELQRAPKTAKDYTESMERYLPRFMEGNMNIVVDSIYDILDLKLLQNIYDRIKNNREWMRYNQRSHASTFTSGLKCYMQFIQSPYYPTKEELLVPVDTKEDGELEMTECDLHTEGHAFVSHCTGYERNRKAREECLAHYGYKCVVCGFDFEKEYGELGRKFIEVHHIVPISSIGKEYAVNPVRDLRPLCSNCHSMIHRNAEVLTIDELKKRREEALKGSNVISEKKN